MLKYESPTVHPGIGHCPLHPLGIPCREMPCEDSAPVVPRYREAFTAERVGQPEHVIGECVDVVGPSAFGFVGEIVAPQIGGDDAQTGGGERPNLPPPAPPEFWEAMQQ